MKTSLPNQLSHIKYNDCEEDEDENYIEYYDYVEYRDEWHRELGPVIAQSEYQHDNVYSFKLFHGSLGLHRRQLPVPT